MITHSPPRRRSAAVLTALAVAASTVALPAGAAAAAEGPAPSPNEYRVIAGIHTDAVSTFLDEGEFVLGSKADVAEGNGTRFDPDAIWFHLENEAQMQLPPSGFDFIAPGGSTVWIAPESNPNAAGRLWPGFSTESIAPGGVDADKTSFTLVDVEGPGDLELFTIGGFGTPSRLWSSDEDLKTFDVGRTHMHANWAFTAAGTYEVTVEGAVTIGGQPRTDQATYTFVVGDAPEAVTTQTSLSATPGAVLLGEPVTLEAAVSPAGVAGYVEFLDGETVLGHETVVDGMASFHTSSLGLGSRQLTARFVPDVANLASASASTGVTVTVTEEGTEEEFGVYGLAESYRAGESIELRVGGATLTEGQQWRWLVRAGEGQTEYTSAALTGTERISRDATVAFDGAQVSVKIIDADRKTVQQTAWYTVDVEGPNVGQGETVDVSPLAESYYRGDDVEVTVDHRPLADGETGRWVARPTPYVMTWSATSEWNTPLGTNPYLIDPAALGYSEFAYEILGADGAVVGRSAAISTQIENRELQVSGIQSVYRVGDTLQADADLHPARDGADYQWYLQSDGGWEAIEGATAPSVSLPIVAGMDNSYLILEVTDASTGYAVGSVSKQVRVTDAAPGEQLVLLDSLSGHYHQGGTIRLNAKADPVASDTDTWRWLWQRPDQDEFVAIEGVTAPSHEVRAQQALDGTLVKAELRTAAGELLATSETATIHVDDHGAAPQEKATISGLAEQYEEGDEVTLTASVSPDSVLSRWEWYVQKPGEDAAMLVEDEHGAELLFAATTEFDGAAVFARLTFDDGRSYVEAPPVLLNVVAGEDPVETTLTVDGLAEVYDAGDTMTLTASQDPDTGEDHWHWFIKPAGAEDYSVIPGQLAATLTREVAAADDGAAIIARLYNHDHEAIAESAPVIVQVNDGDPGGGPQEPQKPSEAPQPRTGDELDGGAQNRFGLSSTTLTQGQIVTLQLGEDHAGKWTAAWLFSTPTLLGGDWAQANTAGAIAVRVPLDAAPGEHRLAVFAADGTVIGWTPVTIVAASGEIPTGALPATGGSMSPLWIGGGILFVVAGAAAVVIGRRRASATAR
ncbi:choice-of-anchor M domain-containing protein [Microbacterium sp. HD4P20]|uniref:choice-of-anchor M domain-containing protein n=1 Tax=Microbacterium sp. HD4P20 TaxID=2864874 RepID=UPI001C63F01C|nr:choice-of-anchor M domain-containing protein [Microbacterium sp. HD4P20]MCP2636514.1 choice-of-anchor M domain-containing protein [Microbacterium sp. HD4P20]